MIKLVLKSLLLITFTSVCFCMDIDIATGLTISFMKDHTLTAGVAFSCWKNEDQLTLVKRLSEHFLLLQISNMKTIIYTLEVKYSHLAIIVDLHCEGALDFLTEASKQMMFKGLHFWLLLSNSEEDMNSWENETTTVLEPLNLQLDSQVTVACPGFDANQVVLHDVYSIGNKSLALASARSWSPVEKFPMAPQRNDFHNIVLKAAVTVIDDPWEHFSDLRYRHLNTMSKLSYVLMSYIATMLNFRRRLTVFAASERAIKSCDSYDIIVCYDRMELVKTDAWGFPLKDSSWYSGVAGLLQRGEVEIGATTLLIKPARLDIIDYAAEAFPFVGNFMFLRPSLSEVSNIYTLPFTRSVWIVIMALTAILTLALVLSQRMEKTDVSNKDYTIEWGDVVMNTMAIVCQQGTQTPPDNFSSRMLFLYLLLLSVFLVASYSAIIVSLLQSSSTSINTVEDLMNSNFKLSMRNITYSITYVNDTNDPTVRKLYFDILYSQPFETSFTSQEIGIGNVRKGLHAFQGDADAYKIMSDTFEEHEKCRYKEIVLFVTNVLAYPVRKHSQYKEMIARKARWLKEIGIVNREFARWYHPKPKCSDNSQGFVSVRLQDFYPALLVFLYGVLLAVIFLLLEIFYHIIQRKLFFKTTRASPPTVSANYTHKKGYKWVN